LRPSTTPIHDAHPRRPSTTTIHDAHPRRPSAPAIRACLGQLRSDPTGSPASWLAVRPEIIFAAGRNVSPRPPGPGNVRLSSRLPGNPAFLFPASPVKTAAQASPDVVSRVWIDLTTRSRLTIWRPSSTGENSTALDGIDDDRRLLALTNNSNCNMKTHEPAKKSFRWSARFLCRPWQESRNAHEIGDTARKNSFAQILV